MRRGFTLVELVMVIMILAIIAGGVSLLIGRLPTSTSVSTSAGTVSQAVRAIQHYRLTEGDYPSRLDLLLANHSADQLPAALAPDLNANGELDDSVPIWELTALDTTTQIATALRAAGIGEVIESPDIDKSKDRNSNQPQTIFGDVEPGGATRVIEMSPGVSPEHVVVLGTDAIARLNLDASGSSTYVVFGLGNNCEAVGNVMLSAPVHSRQEEGAVADRYARFMLVFRIEDTTVSLATVVTLENVNDVATVTGLSDYLQTFYTNRNLSE